MLAVLLLLCVVLVGEAFGCENGDSSGCGERDNAVCNGEWGCKDGLCHCHEHQPEPEPCNCLGGGHEEDCLGQWECSDAGDCVWRCFSCNADYEESFHLFEDVCKRKFCREEVKVLEEVVRERCTGGDPGDECTDDFGSHFGRNPETDECIKEYCDNGHKARHSSSDDNCGGGDGEEEDPCFLKESYYRMQHETTDSGDKFTCVKKVCTVSETNQAVITENEQDSIEECVECDVGDVHHFVKEEGCQKKLCLEPGYWKAFPVDYSCPDHEHGEGHVCEDFKKCHDGVCVEGTTCGEFKGQLDESRCDQVCSDVDARDDSLPSLDEDPAEHALCIFIVKHSDAKLEQIIAYMIQNADVEVVLKKHCKRDDSGNEVCGVRGCITKGQVDELLSRDDGPEDLAALSKSLETSVPGSLVSEVEVETPSASTTGDGDNGAGRVLGSALLMLGLLAVSVLF